MGVCILVRTFKSEYYDLPTKYNKTAVKLLVQSPTRMYAYWEVSDKTIKDFSNNNHDDYNNCIPFLRITNLSMNYSYEIQIDPFANNYYIEVKDTDCDYKVELIRKENEKTFLVTSSNTTHIPRSSPCEYNDEIIFRNCVCLSVTDKFKIYMQKRNNLKKYTDLCFGDFSYEGSVSSLANLN